MRQIIETTCTGWFRIVVLILLGAGGTALAYGQGEDPLDRYLREGLNNNLALEQQNLDLEKNLAALQEARGLFFPSLSLQARYSRAGGGRQIEFPVGDLLNPVYSTLNDLLAAQGMPAGFPTLENQDIAFLRSREQETLVRVIQPLYQPAILHNYRLQQHLASSQAASVNAYREVLKRDIQVAYYSYLKAEKAIEILDAAELLVGENLRVNERLYANERVTQDAVFRARTERLALLQQRREAEKDRDLARSYFNFLVNRPLDRGIERVEEAALLAVFEPSDVRAPAALLPVAQTDRAGIQQDMLKDAALQNRYELQQLDAAIDASQSAVALSRAAFLPGVSFALDLGIQGQDYGFTGDRSFYLASVVLEWKLFNGFQNRSKLEQARLETQRLRTQQDELQKQIQLQVQEAYDNFAVALESLKTAEERLITAREGYRIVSRQYEEGLSNQVTFLDARTSLTEGELNLNITRYDALIRRAELEYATAIPLSD